jgi:hypothetical protein
LQHSFTESASKWTICEVGRLFTESLKQPATLDRVKVEEVRAFLQFQFSHLDHLLAPIRSMDN